MTTPAIPSRFDAPQPARTSPNVPADPVRVEWLLAPGIASLVTDTADWLDPPVRETELLAATLAHGCDLEPLRLRPGRGAA